MLFLQSLDLLGSDLDTRLHGLDLSLLLGDLVLLLRGKDLGVSEFLGHDDDLLVHVLVGRFSLFELQVLLSCLDIELLGLVLQLILELVDRLFKLLALKVLDFEFRVLFFDQATLLLELTALLFEHRPFGFDLLIELNDTLLVDCDRMLE